jgi:hypothetical protein
LIRKKSFFVALDLTKHRSTEMAIRDQKTVVSLPSAHVSDSGKVRLGGMSPSVKKPAAETADKGTVRLGGMSPSVKKPTSEIADKGTVRLGGMSPSI